MTKDEILEDNIYKVICCNGKFEWMLNVDNKAWGSIHRGIFMGPSKKYIIDASNFGEEFSNLEPAEWYYPSEEEYKWFRECIFRNEILPFDVPTESIINNNYNLV
jgi:hypothetical protein